MTNGERILDEILNAEEVFTEEAVDSYECWVDKSWLFRQEKADVRPC